MLNIVDAKVAAYGGDAGDAYIGEIVVVELVTEGGLTGTGFASAPRGVGHIFRDLIANVLLPQIIGQNAIVIFLIWKFDKEISIVEKVASAAFLTAYCIVLVQDTMMTEELWGKIEGLVQSLSLAVPFFSRGPQIMKNFSESSTGALSFPHGPDE